MLRLILSALCLAPLVAWTAELPAYRGDLNEFDNIQHLPSGGGPARLVLGDNNGRIHIYVRNPGDSSGDRLDLPANTLHWAATPSTGPIRILGASIGDKPDPTRADRSEETRARP